MEVAGLVKRQEGLKKWTLIFALCVTFVPVKSSHTFAQDLPCEECRALHLFKTCKRATDGTTLLNMHVIAKCPVLHSRQNSEIKN